MQMGMPLPLPMSLSRLISPDYTPINQNAILVKLLELNHRIYENDNCRYIVAKADIFGILFVGNATTIVRLPITNVLVSGEIVSSVVLEVVNCFQHMTSVGNKDDPYIAEKFLSHLENYYTKKSHSDLVLLWGKKCSEDRT